MQCNITEQEWSYNNFLFLDEGKSYFYIDEDNKNFIFNGRKNALPKELKPYGHYYIAKIGNKELVYISNEIMGKKSIYFLENNTFIKYDVVKSENMRIESKRYEVIFLRKWKESYILVSTEEGEIIMNKLNYDTVDKISELEELYISHDKKHYMLSVTLSSDKEMVIHDWHISKEYLNVYSLKFLKDSNEFWFYGLLSIDQIKKEAVAEFVLNFNQTTNIHYIGKDEKEYVKWWNTLIPSSSFGVQALKSGLYYYWVTDDGEFLLYKWSKLLLSHKWTPVYKWIKSSENDEYATFLLRDKDWNYISIHNHNGEFEKDLLENFNALRLKTQWDDPYQNGIGMSEMFYSDNQIYYILDYIFKLDGNKKIYEILVDNLNFKTIPQWEYSSIAKFYDSSMIKWYNKFFIGRDSEKNRVFFDVHWNKTMLKLDSSILAITKDLDVISSVKNDEKQFSIYENHTFLFHVDDLKNMNIQFSEDFKTYFISWFENKESFIYVNWKKYWKSGNRAIYTKDLKFIKLGDLFFIDWKLMSDKADLYIRKLWYSADKRNLDFVVDNKYYKCDVNWVVQDTKTTKESINILESDKPKIQIQSKKKIFKGLILSSKKLEQTYKWRKNKKKIDTLIPLLNDNKLVKLHKKLTNIDGDKFKSYRYFINYLKAKVWVEIYSRKIVEQ
jgi:hypothetical protein